MQSLVLQLSFNTSVNSGLTDPTSFSCPAHASSSSRAHTACAAREQSAAASTITATSAVNTAALPSPCTTFILLVGPSSDAATPPHASKAAAADMAFKP